MVRATGVPVSGSEEEAVVLIPLVSLVQRLGEFAFDHSQVGGNKRGSRGAVGKGVHCGSVAGSVLGATASELPSINWRNQ